MARVAVDVRSGVGRNRCTIYQFISQFLYIGTTFDYCRSSLWI